MDPLWQLMVPLSTLPIGFCRLAIGVVWAHRLNATSSEILLDYTSDPQSHQKGLCSIYYIVSIVGYGIWPQFRGSFG